MKKFIIITLALVCLMSFFTGCTKQDGLKQYVSQLQSDVFYGESDDYKLKASYGFNEKNLNTDGEANKTTYVLTFTLLDKESDEMTYSIELTFNGENFKGDFSLSPVKNCLICSFMIDDFNAKNFTAQVSCSSSAQTVELNSIVPDKTITYAQALEHLEKKQSALINSYKDSDGVFQGEIHARILVKNDKAYWYIGLFDNKKNARALLIDGKTGDLLAKRDIF